MLWISPHNSGVWRHLWPKTCLIFINKSTNCVWTDCNNSGCVWLRQKEKIWIVMGQSYIYIHTYIHTHLLCCLYGYDGCRTILEVVTSVSKELPVFHFRVLFLLIPKWIKSRDLKNTSSVQFSCNGTSMSATS
jgi:hypothetical protein